MIHLWKTNIFGKQITDKNIVPDLAGRFDEFNELVQHFQGSWISLGDIPDRGLQVKQVLDYFIENKNSVSIFANHEHLMIDFYRGTNFYDSIRWFANGGTNTLVSFCDQYQIEDLQEMILTINQYLYKINTKKVEMYYASDDKKKDAQAAYDLTKKEFNEYIELVRAFVKNELIEEKYIEYLEKAPKFIQTDTMILTHAPINPSLKFERVLNLGINARDMKSGMSVIWNRGGTRRIPNLFQIHGHMAKKQPEILTDKNGVYGLNLDGSDGNKLFVYIGSQDAIYYVDYKLLDYIPNLKIIES